MILDLPDLRQRDDYGCGRVALAVVTTYFGVRTPPVPATPVDGTAPDTLEALLWAAGLLVQAGSMDAADLRHHTRRGRPVVCCVTEPGGCGHWVVVAGLRRGRVHLHCPLGGPRTETAAAFDRRWQDSTRRGVGYDRWGVAAWLR